jgi:hypothetical protein
MTSMSEVAERTSEMEMEAEEATSTRIGGIGKREEIEMRKHMGLTRDLQRKKAVHIMRMTMLITRASQADMRTKNLSKLLEEVGTAAKETVISKPEEVGS